MQKLDVRQINNLTTGNDLAAEMPASSEQRRAFVVVGAYRDIGSGGARVSKFLNADQSDVRFWLRKYEIDKAYIENGWDVAEDDLHDSVFIKGISSLEAVERELAKYLNDFSSLDVSWRRDNPL